MRFALLLFASIALAAPAAVGAGKELEMARLMCREGRTAEALKSAKAAFEASPADPYAGRLQKSVGEIVKHKEDFIQQCNSILGA